MNWYEIDDAQLAEDVMSAICCWAVFLEHVDERTLTNFDRLAYEIGKELARNQSALEFKIRNELFGSDPTEKFKYFCDFWFAWFFPDPDTTIGYPLIDHCQYLADSEHVFQMHLNERIEKIVFRSDYLTYEKFYELLPSVSEKLSKWIEYCHHER